MILRKELKPIGRIVKTHGIKGEINAEWHTDVNPDELRCIVIDIDGIFVPFFLRTARPRGTESYILAFDGIDDDRQATSITGHEIYALRHELPDGHSDDDSISADDITGFEIIANNSPLGTIESYDDSTANILFIVRQPNGKQTYIPAVDDFITGIDVNERTITMALPSEILTIND